ncbi:HlyD family efflux transporter periplasmic adaptor subunit [uncultured Maribacter sp.]|uniref:HlyD family secretion protein n=1 Tax=uncultured Maribacter sp. TaxID=431308 RepID=UPI0030EB6F3F|tara:strand:+ start:31778 stop:32947 length:1170 start_codon:yes stop_codon:yes gene_type:complete
MKEIFPKEIIEHTTQYFIPKNTIRSKFIYGLILLLLVGSLASLPFINISIFSSARGFIKPSKDRMAITSINSGKVIYNSIENNKIIKIGDTLLILQTSVLDEQIILNERKIEVLKNEVLDLEKIVLGKRTDLNRLITPKYKKEIIRYYAVLSEHYTKIKKIKIDFQRNTKLLSKGVIAKVEFDNSKLEFDLANNALHQFQKNSINSWQATLTESNNLLFDLQNNIKQVLNNKKSYVITAPVNGTLINSTSLNDGSFVNAGVQLGEITPDTELIAECYISPKDIGLIDKSKVVSFQIDAFNYNQWGLATGNIIRIADDVEFMDNQPFYKIQCKINQKHLKLKNGYKREIGKGMTLNARFEITERTLYELLYDKMDDWLNPGNGDKLAVNK